MSMFFVPDGLIPDATTMEANLKKISQDIETMLPKGFGGNAAPADLFSTPAAFMALGAGMAGHAFGFWLSAMSNSLQLAEKMSGAVYPLADPDAEAPSYKAPKSAARRTKAAMDTIAADTGVVAGDVLDAGMKAATEIRSAMVDTVVPLRASDKAAQAAAEVAVASDALAKPAAMNKPEIADDLKAITGVGPKLEKVLNGLGIWTYGQIAEFTEAEIRWLDEELGFRGRIARDEWLKQAARLAGKA